MELLDKEYRIYSAEMSELTFRQIKAILTTFSDDEQINDIQAYYDKENDRFILNKNVAMDIFEFCKTGLTRNLDAWKRNLPRLNNYRLAKTIMSAVEMRENLNDGKAVVVLNPDTKFISIGGDIFQISKIVSVKRRDDQEKSYIEVFITNKRTSIRKEFANTTMRDFEFDRISEILKMSA